MAESEAHPIWGFKPGTCKRCKQEKKIGLPSFYALPRVNGQLPWRFAVESLINHCEDCLKDMGLGRKGVFVAVGEKQSTVEALEAELKIAKDLAAERAADIGKPKLY